MKRHLFLFIVVILFAMSMCVFGSERINLINENTYIVNNGEASLENGVLTMDDPTKVYYLASLYVPGLTNDYVWSGDVKILEFTKENYGPAGVRFCIGYDTTTGNYLNLQVTRSLGIAAERQGPNPQYDVYRLTKKNSTECLTRGMNFILKSQVKVPMLFLRSMML